MSNVHSKIRLRRVSPLGAGTICAAITLVFAFIFGGLFLLLAAAGMAGDDAPDFSESGAAGMIGVFIAVVIMYPVMGFIAGAIYAFMFNMISPMIGGLELTVSGLGGESEEVWKDV